MIPNCGPDCERALREVESFLDGEVDPGVRASVEAHLSACNPCMQRAEFRRHLKDLIATKCGSDQMPIELMERVRSMLDARDAPAP